MCFKLVNNIYQLLLIFYDQIYLHYKIIFQEILEKQYNDLILIILDLFADYFSYVFDKFINILLPIQFSYAKYTLLFNV